MKYFSKVFLFFIVLGCASSQKVVNEEKCPKIYKNNYTEIVSEKYKTITNSDTISFNEIRFECVYSALYTHKIMYDKFGKWDKIIYPSNKTHPILVWKKADLFSNGRTYKVYTNGIEEWKHIYASVMVFDENEKDLLTETSTEKTAITNYFASLIKNQNTKKDDFYEVYWKTVNPEHWKLIKASQNN